MEPQPLPPPLDSLLDSKHPSKPPLICNAKVGWLCSQPVYATQKYADASGFAFMLRPTVVNDAVGTIIEMLVYLLSK